MVVEPVHLLELIKGFLKVFDVLEENTITTCPRSVAVRTQSEQVLVSLDPIPDCFPAIGASILPPVHEQHPNRVDQVGDHLNKEGISSLG